MTSNELATTDAPSRELQVADRIQRGVVPRDVVDALKNQIVRGGHQVTDSEFANVLIQADQRGLSPLNGQMWAIVRREKTGDGWQQTLVPQVGIAGLRLIAERTGRYGGRVRQEWCGEDGAWRDVWLAQSPPAAARVTILRDDRELIGIAYYRGSVQTKRDGSPNDMWSRRPAEQLAKCAEADVLRAAFPEELAAVEWTADDGTTGSRISTEVQRALHPGDHAQALADRRGQELKAAGDAAGLDKAGILSLLEGAGLGRPDARVLGEDTPRAHQRFQAMLSAIREHPQDSPIDVIDAEDFAEADDIDADDQTEVTTCDEDGAGRDERPAPIPPPHDGTGNTDPDDHDPADTTEAATLLDHDDQDPAE